MSNILDKYGIKEVADVVFYKIDSSGNPTVPVLYLDTLKVSTIEQTAENSSARGGKGNPELISWDYNKEITVTLEDALFSAKSMAIMYGSVDQDGDAIINEGTDGAMSIRKTFPKSAVSEDKKVTIFGKTYDIPAEAVYYKADGTTGSATEFDFVTFNMAAAGQEIVISSATFPGTYYITGDTYARSEITGEDEFFQFILPKAKIQSEVTLTMEAEGDPSTFSMNLKVLRPADGKMMKLVKYSLTGAASASLLN